MTLTRKRTHRNRKSSPHATRKAPPAVIDSRQVVQRIDAMIRELEILRRQVTPMPKPVTPPGLTEKLFGAAGQGTWEEYDLFLEWERFSEWQHR